MSAPSFRSTFIVQLKDTQNATWQGNVVWADKNISKPFRSALELIKLIDSAVGELGDSIEDEPSQDAKIIRIN